MTVQNKTSMKLQTSIPSFLTWVLFAFLMVWGINSFNTSLANVVPAPTLVNHTHQIQQTP